MVLADCGADPKAAADRMRAVSDESGGAIGWRATGSALWPQQLDLAIAGRRSCAVALSRVLLFDTNQMKIPSDLFQRPPPRPRHLKVGSLFRCLSSPFQQVSRTQSDGP